MRRKQFKPDAGALIERVKRRQPGGLLHTYANPIPLFDHQNLSQRFPVQLPDNCHQQNRSQDSQNESRDRIPNMKHLGEKDQKCRVGKKITELRFLLHRQSFGEIQLS